ncbi:MAG: hypothetical protein V5789_07315 [Colwellia sp.]
MNNISLRQVTAFVIFVCLASFFVNADDALTNNMDASNTDKSAEIHKENTISSDDVQTEEESNDRFTFTSLDLDQNGKLNQQEVVAGKNEWLVRSFNQIDVNADELLTEQELVDFAHNLARTR